MNTFKKGLKDCLVLGSLAFFGTAQLANANICSKDNDEAYLIKATQVSEGQFKLELCEVKNIDSCKPIGSKPSYSRGDITSAANSEYLKGIGIVGADIVLTVVVGAIGVGVATFTWPAVLAGSGVAASNAAIGGIFLGSAGLMTAVASVVDSLNPLPYKRTGDLYHKTSEATAGCTYLPEGQGILQFSRTFAKGLDDRPNTNSVFASSSTKVLEQGDAGVEVLASDAGVNQSSIAR